ncbi:male sterility protein-domain-containing protein [Phycomyces nitens]|nr:male sterility protein-domain-containing protein [Phycomyces nitens]
MAQVPTISITNPDLESQDLSMSSPVAPPDSPTVFDFVKNLQDLEAEEDPLHDPIPITDISSFYHNKSILLTGATGFVGKAVLWKLLESLHDQIDHIYLLIRPGQSGRRQIQAAERIKEDILSNKAFVNLRRKMGPSNFDAMVKRILYPISGDLTLPGLGLSQEDQKQVMDNVHVVLHCAANADGHESLDLAVKTNALGTLQLAELVSACPLSSFIHLSPVQVHHSESEEEHLLPLPEEGPEKILDTILMSSNLDNFQSLYPEFRGQYPNTYLFSKSLAEHLLAKHVDKKRAMGHKQFPMAIIRLSPLGPSKAEPLVGWADGVGGANGILLLTGRGTKAIQQDRADAIADILPVDFAVRMIVGAAATLVAPPPNFVMPLTSTIQDISDASSVSSIRNSAGSQGPSSYRFSSESLVSSATSLQTENTSPNAPTQPVRFPYIYQATTAALQPITWRLAYEAIRYYWTRATSVNLVTSDVYFSPQSLSRARTMMSSIRSAASNYMASNTSPEPLVRTKRNSHRFSRCLDKAAKLSSTVRLNFRTGGIGTSDDQSYALLDVLAKDPSADKFDPYGIVPRDTDKLFWIHYFLNATYGVHFYVVLEPDIRLPSPRPGWASALPLCALDGQHLVDRQVQSDIYSTDQINQRSKRMIRHLRQVVVEGMPTTDTKETKEHDEAWLVDLDDCLEDWSQDNGVQSDQDRRLLLGKWRRKIGSNDEAIKVVVLNDRRVHMAIQQITQKAGVSRITATNEAVKILARMSERTQLAFVWFAGSFLKSVLDDLFESVCVREETIRYIRTATLGKRVVYVPVSKSILDPLLIWYITIRYNLPVPALMCDEATSQLGPISDLYRLAGAYYVKRDKSQRSPLQSAVMAAYSQVLLREHGALAGCLEKSRSRTGKYQPAYEDGLIEMLIEATLETNQSMVSKHSADSPPQSPASVTSLSIEESPRRAHRDVVLVPINITYDNLPELSFLVDEVLDQQLQRRQGSLQITRDVVRPSEAMDKRNKQNEAVSQRRCGRVLFGVGKLVSIQETAIQTKWTGESSQITPLVQTITEAVQESQSKAMVITPVSFVSAIVLYGRAIGGVCVGKIKDLIEWLKQEAMDRGYLVDFQEGEDMDGIICNVFKLLDESKNLIIEGKEINDDTNIRVNDHADNVMALSYYANQMVDVFLLDSFFSVVYLSFSEESVNKDDLVDRFRFLIQMLEREFVLQWDVDQQFKDVFQSYEDRGIIRPVPDNEGQYELCVKASTDPIRYEQMMFLASLVYPTLDAYWITSCSLSALEAVPMLPRCVVPQLAQWIATHLISGRRTIYREVLSTETSKTAVEVFLSLGFLNEIQSKEKLSPDAQILLHELSIPTTETLIELTGQNSEGGKTPVSPIDPEGMMKAMMAQIQMNRANSNMADLCQQIDSYRLGAASQKESFQNNQVFQKCLKQINGILQASTSLAKKRRIALSQQEEGLVQLVYALRANGAVSVDRSANGRALRRVSEAYNLK